MSVGLVVPPEQDDAIKLPTTIYFNSDDEMMFEEEISHDFTEQGNLVEVVPGSQQPGEISKGNRVLYAKLMRASEEERRRIREQFNRQKKR
jgi:hypothetical protein